MILVQLEVKGIKQHNHTAHGTAEAALGRLLISLILSQICRVSPINISRHVIVHMVARRKSPKGGQTRVVAQNACLRATRPHRTGRAGMTSS